MRNYNLSIFDDTILEGLEGPILYLDTLFGIDLRETIWTEISTEVKEELRQAFDPMMEQHFHIQDAISAATLLPQK